MWKLLFIRKSKLVVLPLAALLLFAALAPMLSRNTCIVMYDLEHDHVPGKSDHSDSVVHRFDAFTITKDPNNNVANHCVLDHNTGWLCAVDHNATVEVLDIKGSSMISIPVSSATNGSDLSRLANGAYGVRIREYPRSMVRIAMDQ